MQLIDLHRIYFHINISLKFETDVFYLPNGARIYISPFCAKHFLSTKAAMVLSSIRLSDFLFQLCPPQKVLLCISFCSPQLTDSRRKNKQRRLLKLTFMCRYECVTWLLSTPRRRSLNKKYNLSVMITKL